MLKGISVNGEIKFVNINEVIDVEWIIDYDELLDYCCEVGDAPENEWILLRNDIVKIENDDIVRVLFNK